MTEGKSNVDWFSTCCPTSHAVILWRHLYWPIFNFIHKLLLVLVINTNIFDTYQHVLSPLTPIEVTWPLRLPSPNGNARISFKIQPIATSWAFPTSRKTLPEKTPREVAIGISALIMKHSHWQEWLYSMPIAALIFLFLDYFLQNWVANRINLSGKDWTFFKTTTVAWQCHFVSICLILMLILVNYMYFWKD